VHDSRWDRVVPLSGIAAVAAVGVASALVGIYDYLPSGERLVAAFSGSSSALVAAGFVGNLGAFFFMWFAGSTFRALRRADEGDGWLSLVGLGSGFAGALVLGIGFSALIATGSRAGSTSGLSAAEAITLYDFYSNILGQLFGVTMAVFMVAASASWLKSRQLPAWFNWASVVVAVTLLTPAAYLFLILTLLWLAVVSVWMTRGGSF
jgi:hypothetical protein